MHHLPQPGFLPLKDLINDQGDVMLIIETNSMFPDTPKIVSFSCLLPSPSQNDIYFEACSLNPCTTTFQLANKCNRHPPLHPTQLSLPDDTPLMMLVAKKKYKPVALKTCLVLGTLPLKFCIEHNIIGDLLTNIPTLPPILLPFAPHGHYTNK